MQLDTARYRHHLNRFDMSEKEKLTFMEQLWPILRSFVTRAVHGEADARLLGIDHAKAARVASDRLDSKDALTSTFNEAAGGTAAGKTTP